jgi:hypothetical protein
MTGTEYPISNKECPIMKSKSVPTRVQFQCSKGVRDIVCDTIERAKQQAGLMMLEWVVRSESLTGVIGAQTFLSKMRERRKRKGQKGRRRKEDRQLLSLCAFVVRKLLSADDAD